MDKRTGQVTQWGRLQVIAARPTCASVRVVHRVGVFLVALALLSSCAGRSQVADLEESNAALQRQVTDLKSQVDQLSGSVEADSGSLGSDDLEDRVRDLERNDQIQDEGRRVMVREVGSLDERLTELDAGVKDLCDQLENLDDQIRNSSIALNPGIVGFTANIAVCWWRFAALSD